MVLPCKLFVRRVKTILDVNYCFSTRASQARMSGSCSS
jgi:hypothetical protein